MEERAGSSGLREPTQARKWPSSQKVEVQTNHMSQVAKPREGTANSGPDPLGSWWGKIPPPGTQMGFVIRLWHFLRLWSIVELGSYNLSAKEALMFIDFLLEEAESSIWVASIESSQVSGRSLNAKKLGISILVSFLIWKCYSDITGFTYSDVWKLHKHPESYCFSNSQRFKVLEGMSSWDGVCQAGPDTLSWASPFDKSGGNLICAESPKMIIISISLKESWTVKKLNSLPKVPQMK